MGKPVKKALLPKKPAGAAPTFHGRLSTDGLKKLANTDDLVAAALGSPVDSRQVALVNALASHRLAERSRNASPDNVRRFLQHHRDQGHFAHSYTLKMDTWLCPLDLGHYNRVNQELDRKLNDLAGYIDEHLECWGDLLLQLHFRAESAFNTFLPVASKQALEDWKVAHRLQRLLCAVLQIGVSVAFGGIGLGFIGAAVSSALVDTIESQMKPLVPQFMQMGDEAIKDASADMIKGAVGDVGGMIKDSLHGKCDEWSSDSQSMDARATLDTMHRQIVDLKRGLRDAARARLAIIKKEVFGALVEGIAWHFFFQDTRRAKNLHVDGAIAESVITVVGQCIEAARRSVAVVVGYPFDQRGARGDDRSDKGFLRGAEVIIEKIFWATYILSREDLKKKDHLCNDVLEALLRLGVGHRRPYQVWFYHGDEAEDAQNTANSLQLIAKNAKHKNARMERLQEKVAHAETNDIVYGKKWGGAYTDKQLLAWARAYLNTNPMAKIMRARPSFVAETAPNRMDPMGWSELVNKYAAAGNTASVAVNVALGG